MSYVRTIAQFKIFDTFITGDLYPIVLFDIPIPYITEIQIIKDTNDKNEYIVTLYTKQFKINLDRKTFIHNRLEIEEYRDVFEKVTQINLHDTLFLNGTVRLKQKNDIINARVPYSVTQDDTNTYDTSKNSNKYSDTYQNLYDNDDNSNIPFDINPNVSKEFKNNNEYQKQRYEDDENNLQSTQNTLIIIGLFIIAVLFGFGIYLYFKKQ